MTGLEHKIEDIKTFLSSMTSTKTGIKNYMQRAKKINERYGTNFTWDTLNKYYESELEMKIDEKYGSKVKMKAVAYIQKNKDKIL